MAFDPLSSPSRNFFGETRFANSVGREASVRANIARSTIAGNSYVEAAKRVAQFQQERDERLLKQQQAQQQRSSRGGLFGAIAGGLTSLIPGVGPALAPVVGSAVGSLTSRA
jgi:hypothetical protein